MNRAYYSSSIAEFCRSSPHEILGILSATSEFTDEQTQKESWKEEIRILKEVLQRHAGSIYFEYSIPRMGRRIGPDLGYPAAEALRDGFLYSFNGNKGVSPTMA